MAEPIAALTLPPVADPVLEISGLDVRYGQSHILQGVDLAVGADPLALIGRNGDGWTIKKIYELFPPLASRRKNGAMQLSGGEQQMLAIARALLLNPHLLIMDEPSEGLAPIVVEHLVGVLRDLAREDVTLLLVEQNLGVATSVAERIAIMVTGRIALETTAAEILADEAAQRRYLGVSALVEPAGAARVES